MKRDRGTYFSDYYARNRARKSAANRAYNKTPYGRYCDQRKSARKRGIEFKLTFDEWTALWNGKYHLRGNRPDDLCMARNGDTGAYEIGNVHLTSNRLNSSERFV